MTKNELIKQSVSETRSRRKSQACRVFICKVNEKKLSELQEFQLRMLFIEAKWYFNYLLSSENIFNFDWKTNNIKHFNKDGELVDYNLQFLSASFKQTIQAELEANIKALAMLKKKGIQGPGKINYKSVFKSLNYKQLGITHKFKTKRRVKLQGIKGTLYINGLDQFDQSKYEIANLKLLNRPNGYYLAITTYSKPEAKQTNGKILGLDFGCSTSITTSEGVKYNIKIRETEHLKSLQRKLSRQVKGSNNFKKTKALIWTATQKLNNKKTDITNKLVNQFIKYDKVIIQDEQLQAWHKTNSKAVQYSILGRVKTKLKENSNCIIIDKFVPTTKLCTNCGKYLDMPVSKRVFKCDCGIETDRDIHAAQNLVWIYNNIVGTEQTKLTPVEIKDKINSYFELKKQEVHTPLGCE